MVQVDVQQRLGQLLQDQESRYSAAIELIDRMSQAETLADAAGRKDLIELQQHLANVRSLGASLAAATAEWEAAGKPRSMELNAMLDRQERVLSEFLSRMDKLQNLFGADREHLRHRLDQASSRKLLHAAYQKALKTR